MDFQTKIIIKHFNNLDINELYEIIKLRLAVFVLEQNVAYQDLDDIDKNAYHIYLTDVDGMQAYLRLFIKNNNPNEAIIGRVLTTKRHCGYGNLILKEAIKYAKQNLKINKIVLNSQKYIISMYEKLGFKQVSDEFIEDEILHVKMQMNL